MPIQGYVYDSDGADHAAHLEPGLLRELGEHSLLWIDIDTSREDPFEILSELLSLDRRSVVDLRLGSPVLRVENYGTYVQFSVLPVPSAERDQPSPRIDFLVGENWIVTLHRGDVPFLGEFRDQDRGETSTGSLSAATFASTLLDWHLETYFREVGDIEGEIDDLDDRALADPSDDDLLERILLVRRRITRLRRALATQRPVFYGLERPDVIAATQGASIDQLALLNARYERALDEIERARELVLGSFDLLTSRIGQLTNDLVKALTFFTVIIGTAAAIAGLFGMNFDPPFFRSGFLGFFMVTGGLLLASAIAYLIARRRKWL